jgi:hypothetical protein
MIPRLGEKYDVEIKTISRDRAEYATAEYLELGLPKAPAIMVGDELVVQGADISEENLELLICKHLGLPAPEPQQKGIFGRILKK